TSSSLPTIRTPWTKRRSRTSRSSARSRAARRCFRRNLHDTDRADAAGEKLFVALAAGGGGAGGVDGPGRPPPRRGPRADEGGEADGAGVAGGRLRGGPVAAVAGEAAVLEVARARRFQVAIHQHELVARRQEPAADAVHDEAGAEVRRAVGLGAGGNHVGGVL